MFDFRLGYKVRYAAIFVSCCLIGAVVLIKLPLDKGTTGIIALLTAIGGLTGFFYSRHSQELQIFRELFKDFNGRYDLLNERLNLIKDRPVGKSLDSGKDYSGDRSDKAILNDYFNLCAEQHIYASAGYIDRRVWEAWKAGMAYFAEDAEIRQFWEQELRNQKKSYYNFSLSEICAAEGPMHPGN